MTDDLHKRAVEAAAAQMRDECGPWFADRPEAALFDWHVAATNAINAYLRCGSEDGVICTRPTCKLDGECGCADGGSDREVAPGPEDGER